jgi:hypothetical protein
MLADLTPECERCGRPLGDPGIVLTTDAGERRAYECGCGAVTVTVARPGSGSRSESGAE